MKKVLPKSEIKKTVQRGKYVYKPITSTIVVCACGNKYVSTRFRQKTCVTCIQNS